MPGTCWPGYGGLLSFGNQVFVGLGGFALAIAYYYTPLNHWSSLVSRGAWPDSSSRGCWPSR